MDIFLTALPNDEIATQVRSVRPGAGAAEIAEVQRLSQGVPLFVEELVDNPEGPRSSTIRTHLAARLLSLEAGHARILEAAAHEPRPFSSHDLSIVAGAHRSAVDAAVDAAVEVRLLESAGPRWRFRHELLRLAAMDSAAPSASVSAHRAWAQHLGSSAVADDLVAAADHEEALGCLRRTLRHASGQRRRYGFVAPTLRLGRSGCRLSQQRVACPPTPSRMIWTTSWVPSDVCR